MLYGLSYGGDSIASRRGWRTYAAECAIADEARARQAKAAAELEAARNAPLQRIDGGWLAQSNGVVLGKFFGVGSKRRALTALTGRSS